MKQASTDGGLRGLIESATAAGDVESMWKDLATVAPDDIRVDTETVRDDWQKIADKEADRNFFAALIIAVSSARATQRVNDYIAAKCGIQAAPLPVSGYSLGSSAPTPTPTPTPTDVTAASVKLSGESAIKWHYGPRAVITDLHRAASDPYSFSTVAAVNGAIVRASATAQPADPKAELRGVVLGVQQDPSRAPDFVVASLSHLPASGLVPEKWLARLQRYHADGTPSGRPVDVAPCDRDGCEFESVALFGDVAVVGYSGGAVGVSLATRAVVWSADDIEPLESVNPVIVVRSIDARLDETASIYAIRPESGQTAWHFKDATGQEGDGMSGLLAPDRALVYSGKPPLGGPERISIVNLQSGATIASRFGDPPEVSAAFDPTTGRYVLAGIAQTAAAVDAHKTYLETLDDSSRSVFSIPPAQYSALDEPDVLVAAGGEVWIATPQGVDAVDSQTGIQSSNSPQIAGSDPVSAVPILIDHSVALLVTAEARYSGPTVALIVGSGSPTVTQILAAGAG